MSKGKLSKRARTLLAVCAAVVVLAGALTTLLLLPAPEDSASSGETSSTPAITVVDRSKDAEGETVENPVKSMTIQLESEEIAFITGEDGGLIVEQYKDLEPETYELSALASQTASITAVKDYGAVENPADYGFDNPTATVSATYHDDSTFSFEIGSQTPLKDGYYLRETGGTNVYEVELYVAETFTVPSTDYIGTTLMTSPEVREDDDSGQAVLRDMELSGTVRADKPFAFRMVTTEDTDFSLYTYMMTSPYLRGCNSDKIQNLQSFTALTASSAVKAYPTEEDLAAYGLDEPYSVAELHTAVSTLVDDPDASSTSSGEEAEQVTSFYNVAEHTIRVGDTDEDGNYYVMVDDIPVVYLVSSSSISTWVEAQYDDLADSLLFMRDITTVKNVSITIDGEKTTFDLTHYPDEEDRDDMMVVKSGDQTLDTASFRSLYQNLMGITRYGATESKPTGDPDVTVEIVPMEGEGDTIRVDLYQKDASLYTCVQDTGEYYEVKASLVTRIIENVPDYLAGEEIVAN